MLLTVNRLSPQFKQHTDEPHCWSVVSMSSVASRFRPHLLTYYLPRWRLITAVHLQRCIHLDDQVMLYLLLQCTALTAIDLHRCSQLTDTLFSYLSFAPCARHLLSIVVSGCDGLTSAAVGSVARYCPSLQLLDMDDCDGMNDRTLQSASQLPSLRTLRLAGADVRDCGVAQLTALPRLTHLSLQACQHVTTLSAGSLAVLGKLEWLDLTQLPLITDAMVGVLASSLPLLSTLLLSRCPLLTSTALHAIAASLRCLTSLTVSWCALMADDGLSALSSLSCLSSLCMSRLPRLTDRSLLSLSRCESLRVLDVSGCQSITDVGLGYVGRGCRELRELNVSGCYKVRLTTRDITNGTAHSSGHIRPPPLAHRLTLCLLVTDHAGEPQDTANGVQSEDVATLCVRLLRSAVIVPVERSVVIRPAVALQQRPTASLL